MQLKYTSSTTCILSRHFNSLRWIALSQDKHSANFWWLYAWIGTAGLKCRSSYAAETNIYHGQVWRFFQIGGTLRGEGGGVFEISKNREKKIDPITAAYRSLKTRSSKVQISQIISSLFLDFTWRHNFTGGQLQIDAQSSEGNSFSLYALTLCLAANMCNFVRFFYSSTA